MLSSAVVCGRVGGQWRECCWGDEEGIRIGIIVKNGKSEIINGNDGMWK